MRALADPAIESGVPNGRALLAFASAAVAGAAGGVGDDDARLPRAREALRAELGDAGVADAAAVASNFERMVRIADSTGIELGGWMESFTEDVRADLSLDRLRVRPDGSGRDGPRLDGSARGSPPAARLSAGPPP